MTRKEALADLIAKVEAGEERYPFSWANEGYNTGDLFDSRDNVNRAYNGSLDAAKALHEAVLPGFGWTAGGGAVRVYKLNGLPCSEHVSATPTPARAWLIAILRALHAQEP